MAGTTEVKETVLAFVKAVNDEDFQAARQLANDDLTFVGVMGSRSGADVYFKDMERMKLKYAIKKVFVDEQDVCLWYDIDMSGVTVLSSGWYHVEAGKVSSIKVLFDPRPVLEAADKKKS